VRRRRGTIGRLVRAALWGAALAAAVAGGSWGLATGLPVAQAALRDERLHLRAVDWLGLDALDAAALTASLGEIDGIALIDLDVSAIERRIASHPRVERCLALRLPPDRLVLRVVERTPVGRLAGGTEAFDPSGERFPLLPGEAERLVPVRGDRRAAIPLLEEAKRLGVDLAEVDAVSTSDVRFRMPESKTVVRLGADPGRALEDWLRVRAAGVMERYQPQEVDLRFHGSAVLRGASRDLEGG